MVGGPPNLEQLSQLIFFIHFVNLKRVGGPPSLKQLGTFIILIIVINFMVFYVVGGPSKH